MPVTPHLTELPRSQNASFDLGSVSVKDVHPDKLPRLMNVSQTEPNERSCLLFGEATNLTVGPIDWTNNYDWTSKSETVTMMIVKSPFIVFGLTNW